MSAGTGKSVLRSIIGWLIVVFIAIWLLDIAIGTVRVLARLLFWIVIIGLLVVAYFKLQSDDE